MKRGLPIILNISIYYDFFQIGGMSKSVGYYIHKSDNKGVNTMVKKQIAKTLEKMNSLEVDR